MNKFRFAKKKKKKFRRTLQIDSICNICGHAEENSHHAVVECTKPKALRFAMRSHLQLPPQSNFVFSGPDWLQLMLANCSLTQRNNILMF
jgi:hypothetical protein